MVAVLCYLITADRGYLAGLRSEMLHNILETSSLQIFKTLWAVMGHTAGMFTYI